MWAGARGGLALCAVYCVEVASLVGALDCGQAVSRLAVLSETLSLLERWSAPLDERWSAPRADLPPADPGAKGHHPGQCSVETVVWAARCWQRAATQLCRSA